MPMRSIAKLRSTAGLETTLMGISAPSVLGNMPAIAEANGKKPFIPKAVTNFEETGLSPAMIESLVLKFLVNTGIASGRRIAAELGLPFGPFPDFLRQLKNQQIVAYTNSATANDYIYSLTDCRADARQDSTSKNAPTSGTAPVPFDDYLESVSAQTITTEHPQEADLRAGVLRPVDLGRDLRDARPGDQLGPRDVPLRLSRQRQDQHRRADHPLLRHDRLDSQGARRRRPDHQALRHGQPRADRDARPPAACSTSSTPTAAGSTIRRPTIVAGGELRMEDLEIHYDPATKFSEAPLQLKSNLGTFLIDDFGRQRMQPIELLNRWIVPLEKRYDFLSLANGKKIRVPFDQLILFSTNLEPKQLVDEAFLRRIPYKINATDPTEPMFRKMFDIFAPKLGFQEVDRAAVDYLIQHHYQRVGRPFRCCQPRDLLLQVRNYCIYNGLPLELKPEYFDFAAMNYFTVT